MLIIPSEGEDEQYKEVLTFKFILGHKINVECKAEESKQNKTKQTNHKDTNKLRNKRSDKYRMNKAALVLKQRYNIIVLQNCTHYLHILTLFYDSSFRTEICAVKRLQ